MNAHAKESTKSRGAISLPAFMGLFALAFGFVNAPAAWAADYKEAPVEWRFESGLDKTSFGEVFKKLAKENFRIADVETYRSGRAIAVTTVWTKLAASEAWQIEMSLPVADFIKADEKHRSNGYSLVEFEIDRFGATLHFSGIWMTNAKGLDTEFHFGMESLEFSNRYGEMADRGYRLIDFEAYEANGKFRHAGVWLKNDGHEVRFYRAIPKNQFSRVASQMSEAGFRLTDLEGYQFENDFVFAGEWVRLSDGQEDAYAFDLLADEFYNKNAGYVRDDYRLTEFEVYEDNGTIYYAGSWLKSSKPGEPAKTGEDEKKSKPMSLEAFRSGGE